MVITQTEGQLSMNLTRPVKSGITGGQPVTLRFSGGHMIYGGGAGATVTVKLQLAELPCESVAVQVTVVVPIGNAKPLGGLHTRLVIVPQVLDADGSG
jgi:hypothetical protein